MLGNSARETPTFGFIGSLDEVAIYPSALSDARVDAHYRAGRGLP